MRTLIVCSSPYTVFNAINYAMGTDEQVDILIFINTETMKKIYQELLKNNIFHYCFCCADFNFSKSFILKSVIACILPHLFFRRKLCRLEDVYEKIISQNFYFATLVYRICKKATFYLIEDGLGSYVYRVSEAGKRNKYMLWVHKYIFLGGLIPDISGQYIYHPEMVEYTPNRAPGLKLNCSAFNKVDIIKRVFSYKESGEVIKSKCVVFGDSMMSECFYVDSLGNRINKYSFLNKYIFSKISKENIIYRPHPFEKDYSAYIEGEIDNTRNMWELDSLYNITDNNVLINYYSTAVVTPKLMFDKEPYILFLFSFIDYYNDKYEDFSLFIDKIRKLYRAPDKICIAKTIDDIDCFFKGINNKHDMVQ